MIPYEIILPAQPIDSDDLPQVYVIPFPYRAWITKIGVSEINGDDITPSVDVFSIDPTTLALTVLPASTNGTTTVTMASTVGLVAGMYVSGPGIPFNATIESIVPNTSIVLSSAATTAVLNNVLTFNLLAAVALTGDTDATTTVTMASTTGVTVGMTVSGAGIPAGTLVTTVTTDTSVTLSQAATTSVSDNSLIFTSGTNANREGPYKVLPTFSLVAGIADAVTSEQLPYLNHDPLTPKGTPPNKIYIRITGAETSNAFDIVLSGFSGQMSS